LGEAEGIFEELEELERKLAARRPAAKVPKAPEDLAKVVALLKDLVGAAAELAELEAKLEELKKKVVELVPEAAARLSGRSVELGVATVRFEGEQVVVEVEGEGGRSAIALKKRGGAELAELAEFAERADEEKLRRALESARRSAKELKERAAKLEKLLELLEKGG